ncbi:sirohydrochlorin chelatase [Geodermatophilus sp. SYSU D00758]
MNDPLAPREGPPRPPSLASSRRDPAKGPTEARGGPLREGHGPVLVACAHGTRNPTGRRLVAELALAARALRPGLQTTAAFVDVQPPTVADVVAGLSGAGRSAVVVPVLLSGGYHVHVDIARAVDGVAGAVAARALGPDPRLAEVLHDRLEQAGADPRDPLTAVVLAAAGSSDPRSVADVEDTADLLQRTWAGPVTTGYGSAARPPVPEAVAAARRAGAERVVVAAYLLAPGHFHDKLGGAGADAVTAPLLPDERVAAVLLDRYDAAM